MEDFFKTREQEEMEIDRLVGQLNRRNRKKAVSRKNRGGAKP